MTTGVSSRAARQARATREPATQLALQALQPPLSSSKRPARRIPATITAVQKEASVETEGSRARYHWVIGALAAVAFVSQTAPLVRASDRIAEQAAPAACSLNWIG